MILAISYVFIGFVLGVLDMFILKHTIKVVIKNKNPFLLFLSLFMRMLIFSILFFIFMGRDWKKAIFMVLGITLVKFSMLLFSKTKVVKIEY